MFLQWQRTPLHNAVAWGRIDIVKILLTKGADINAKDEVSEGSVHSHSSIHVFPFIHTCTATNIMI